MVGDGVYKISGGANGSFLLGVFIGMALIALIITSGGLAAAIIGSIGINGAFLSLFYMDLANEDFDARCFASGLLFGLTGASLGLGGVLFGVALGDIMTVLGLGASVSPNFANPLQCLGIQ